MDSHPQQQQKETEKAPPLPLGWTQVRRKRPRSEGSSRVCCEEECGANGCQRNIRKVQLPPLKEGPLGERIFGNAVFFLHEPNPSWMQGYFFPTKTLNSKAWGILATQEEVDECLQCSEGGYRVLNISVNAFNGETPHNIESIEWLGGDMMYLSHPSILFQAGQVLTGQRAAEALPSLFRGIAKKLKSTSPQDSSLLELLPEMAIVHGTMSMILPNSEKDDLWG